MPPRLRFFFLTLTVVLLLMPTLAFYEEFSRRPDIWWTPPSMALSLAEGRDRVEVYARGKPLSALLAAQQLWIKDERGSSPWGLRTSVSGSIIGSGPERRAYRCCSSTRSYSVPGWWSFC